MDACRGLLHSIDPKNELIISITEAVTQADSESRSGNILWGIKRSAANPDAPLYARPCYGYRKDEEGRLAIYEIEACTVILIFDMYLSGSSVLNIKRELESRGILTPTGKPVWPKRTIETILANEKYAGDVRLFKTYSAGFPDKRRLKNKGERDESIATACTPESSQRSSSSRFKMNASGDPTSPLMPMEMSAGSQRTTA